jgi:hypothetical protein
VGPGARAFDWLAPAHRNTSVAFSATLARDAIDLDAERSTERAKWERAKTDLDAERSIDPELLRPPERTCSCFRPTSHPLRIHSPPLYRM